MKPKTNQTHEKIPETHTQKIRNPSKRQVNRTQCMIDELAMSKHTSVGDKKAKTQVLWHRWYRDCLEENTCVCFKAQ